MANLRTASREALRVPKGEVDLLVKVHKIVMRPYEDVVLAPAGGEAQKNLKCGLKSCDRMPTKKRNEEAMIINNNETSDVSRLNLDKTQGSSPAAGTTASNFAATDSAPGSDSVSLSNLPNLVQQALSSSSPARLSRVQELKALVQSNQYQPDAQEVSRALIDAHITGA